MKKKLVVFLVLFLLSIPTLVIAKNRIYFDSSNISFEKGETYDIDIKVESDLDFSEVGFNVITTSNYISFDDVKLNSSFENKSNSGYLLRTNSKQKSGTVVATLTISIDKKTPAGDVGTIKIVEPSIVTDKKIELDVEQLNINVSEEVNSTYLSSLKSEISPFTFDKDILSYEVEVDNDIEEFDLVAIAEDSDAEVNISSQKLDKRKNIIIVKVTKEGLEDREYKITVLKKNATNKVIDKKESKSDKKNTKRIKMKWIFIIAILIGLLIVDLFFVKRTRKIW